MPSPLTGRDRDIGLPTILLAGFAGTLGAGVREIVRRDVGFTVVAGEGDEGEIATLIAEHRPAAALVNHEALQNVISVRRLVLAYPSTPMVMAVMRLSRERDARLLEAGVRVVVPITIDGLELCGVLRLVAYGLVGTAGLSRSGAGAGVGLLTEREAQVMGLLVLRRSAREIAQELHVTEATVNTHRRHIYEKLGVHSRAELAEHASRLLDSGRRKDDVVPPAARDQAPFRRRGYGVGDNGRPSRLDMRCALGIVHRRSHR